MNSFDFEGLCLELEQFRTQSADQDFQANLVKTGALCFSA